MKLFKVPNRIKTGDVLKGSARARATTAVIFVSQFEKIEHFNLIIFGRWPRGARESRALNFSSFSPASHSRTNRLTSATAVKVFRVFYTAMQTAISQS